MNRTTRILLLTLILPLNNYSFQAQIVLSEIMFDAPENEAYEEFIELYNRSATETIDLTGYQAGDQTKLDSLADYGQGFMLPPEGYALILDRGYWDNSTIYNDLIPSNCLILTLADNAFGTSGLRNSPPDTVMLRDPSGSVVASYTYSCDNLNGYSEEKIRLSGTDEPSNWTNSLTCLGTPGFTNTVQPLQFDLAVTNITAEPSPLPLGSVLTLTAGITNLGLEPSLSTDLIITIGRISEVCPDSILAEIAIPVLQPGDSTEVNNQFASIPPGSHRVIVWHDKIDDNQTNDTLDVVLPGGYPQASIIINEIFAKPDDNRCEWIELYNASSMNVDLFDFTLSDADTSQKSVITDSSCLFYSGDYLVIAQDSSIFNWQIPPDALVMVLGSDWSVLNNDGDIPTLFDASGAVQDSVNYSGWEIPADVSMERVYWNGGSDDPLNWQPSAADQGGTPGQFNSYGYQESPFSLSGEMTFSPDPFDPERHSSLEISITMPKDAISAAVLVFDLRGRKLKTIFDGGLPPNPILWNGRDADNRTLSPGVYIIFSEFRDSSGNRTQSIKKTLIIAGRL